MKRGAGIALTAAAVAAALGVGYWLGGRGNSHEAPPAAQTAAGEPAKKERKLLYYRNPMGLPDTSPVPKKDPMGMDYVPVYEGEEDSEPASAGQIKISVDKVQKLGVKTEAATLRQLTRTVRAVGRIEPNERRVYTIAPKFEGWIEKLHVNATGDLVRAGQPLFEVYSPELVSAQREYAIAAQGVDAMREAHGEAQAAMKELAQSSLIRLRNWDITDDELRRLRQTGEAKRTVVYRSPVRGFVLEKPALKGMRFMPGEVMYKIADLSTVWLIADVFEQDIGLVKPGQTAKVVIDAYPGREFEGRVDYVYPTLNTPTRTVPVRVEMANPDNLLRPGMYAQIRLATSATAGKVVTVPDTAVIHSGRRQVVLIERGEGRFEPRDVKLGLHTDDYIEVLEGVAEGEKVVVAANFLIDAESNLKAALGGFGGHAAHGGAAPKSEGQPSQTAPAAGGHAGHGVAPMPGAQPAASAGHRGEGTVEGIDAKAGLLTLNHGPIDTLKWPGMTMNFKVANEALLAGVKPGMAVAFEFVERAPGEWVVTRIEPRAQSGASEHKGH
ncbi:MAG: efflux RND transporter periplasmic adaptor subunit [Pseudomonadota bacterium]